MNTNEHSPAAHEPARAAPSEMTVVVIVLLGRKALARCLTALTQQAGAPDVHIIVPYDARHPDVVFLQAAFPDVEFLRAEGGLRTYAELRAMGVRQAQGQIVALTEDHCIPRPDWCAEILKAHAAPPAAVGGAVEKAEPDTRLNWALYLADYVRYANPRPEGPVDHLTDCNVSYKLSALQEIAEVWQREFHEPEVHAALQAQGKSLWFSPRVVVDQQRSIDLRQALRDRYAFGRLFGGRRAEGLPLGKRLAYAGSAVLLPPLLVARVAKHVFGRRRYTRAFVRALPFVVLLSSVWAGGELLGYLTGQAAGSLTPGQQQPAEAAALSE